MKKDMVWHELYDTMQQEQCPICELIYKRTLQSMEAFLYERVNDITIRAEICNSNGFCNHHAYMMMDIGDPLAHALIYSDLLKDGINSINAPNAKQSNTNGLCLFCRQSKKSEGIYTEAFADAFKGGEFSRRYSEGGLLCVPHFKIIRNLQKRTDKTQIEEITLVKYKTLIRQLSEIKRKSDYRFSHELWSRQEASAWKRAVYAVNAKRGINILEK